MITQTMCCHKKSLLIEWRGTDLLSALLLLYIVVPTTISSKCCFELFMHQLGITSLSFFLWISTQDPKVSACGTNTIAGEKGVAGGAWGEGGGLGVLEGEEVRGVCALGAAREGRAPQGAAVEAYTRGGDRWWGGCARGPMRYIALHTWLHAAVLSKSERCRNMSTGNLTKIHLAQEEMVCKYEAHELYGNYPPPPPPLVLT